MAAELEVVTRERPLFREEDDDQTRAASVDRHREQRLEGRVAPLVVEAIVLAHTRRRDDATVRCSLGQRRRGVDAVQLVGQLVRTGDGQPPAFGHEHSREGAADRLAGRMGSRIERLGARERLREEVRDSRERPLDTRLPASLREALGVAEGERCETGERLEQIEVVMIERAPSAAAHADAENAADLTAPDHRGDERVHEAAIRIVRYLLLELVVGVDCDRTLPLHSERGNTAVGRKLEADQVLVEPVDGCTAQRATLGVEEIAVRSVDAEELRHFLDEPA